MLVLSFTSFSGSRLIVHSSHLVSLFFARFSRSRERFVLSREYFLLRPFYLSVRLHSFYVDQVSNWSVYSINHFSLRFESPPLRQIGSCERNRKTNQKPSKHHESALVGFSGLVKKKKKVAEYVVRLDRSRRNIKGAKRIWQGCRSSIQKSDEMHVESWENILLVSEGSAVLVNQDDRS